MPEHLVEVKHFCSNEVINSIYTNSKNKIGIISDIDILNQNGKCIGVVGLLMSKESKGLKLSNIVEFNKDKITWRSTILSNGKGFYLVDKYWVKKYFPDPAINVPVKIYDPKSRTISVEFQKLTYKQFRERKLFEFAYKYEYRVVAAYNNFRHMYSKTKDYYFSLNSTIKHYHIDQDDLKKIISCFNHEIKKFKKEWTECLQESYNENYSVKALSDLSKESNKSIPKNVLPLVEKYH
jgi:hypothetical protein